MISSGELMRNLLYPQNDNQIMLLTVTYETGPGYPCLKYHWPFALSHQEVSVVFVILIMITFCWEAILDIS